MCTWLQVLTRRCSSRRCATGRTARAYPSSNEVPKIRTTYCSPSDRAGNVTFNGIRAFFEFSRTVRRKPQAGTPRVACGGDGGVGLVTESFPFEECKMAVKFTDSHRDAKFTDGRGDGRPGDERSTRSLTVRFAPSASN